MLTSLETFQYLNQIIQTYISRFYFYGQVIILISISNYLYLRNSHLDVREEIKLAWLGEEINFFANKNGREGRKTSKERKTLVKMENYITEGKIILY